MATKITVIFLFLTLYSYAQDYGSLRIKEEYDENNRVVVGNDKPCTSSANDDAENFGDGMTYILEGYITMYETTNDKAYLYKFILESLCMMQNRHDYAGVESVPRWSMESMYINGNIIVPFARFVYFVKNNPNIYNTGLYQFPEIANNSFNVQFNTFGDFANWLQDRCGETLWWFTLNGYWTSDGFRRKTTSTAPAEINMQSGFGRALLYIGLSANESDFLDKAMVLANKYKSNISLSNPCEGKSFNGPVFQVTSDNSYQWYHRGWQVEKKDCWSNKFPFFHNNVDNYSKYTEFREDISHGAPVTWLPNDFLKYQPNTPFNQTDMIRFKNMFAKHIYDGNGSFFNAVDGTDNPVSCTNCGTNLPHNYSIFEFRPLSYMYLNQYDNYETTSSTVYEIVMEDYIAKISGESSLPGTYDGQANKGHAEVVAAQWDKECVSLTLYNRDVVYNQNFEVKNVLTIDPMGGTTTASFAEPIINAQTFTVEPGVTANFTAGEEIVWKAGTHIKAGSNVHAYIQPSACINGIMPSSNPPKQVYQDKILSDVQSVETLENETINTKKDVVNSFAIYPNPGKGMVNIEIDDESIQSFEYKVINVLGTTIQSGMVRGNITSLSLEKGVYIVHVGIDNSWYIQRLVIE